MNQLITSELIKFKKVRLIEDHMSYEDLALMDNFSEDELTFDLSRKIIRDAKHMESLNKARKIETHI